MSTSPLVSEEEIPTGKRDLEFLNIKYDLKDIPMFDYFFIVGLPKKFKDLIPKVLFQYPKTGLPFSEKCIDSIIDYCFPNSIKKNSSSGQSGHILDEFHFRLIIDEVIYYGICCHFRFSRRLDSSDFVDRNTNFCYPFCLLLISRLPLFLTHFEFLEKIVSIFNNTSFGKSKSEEQDISSEPGVSGEPQSGTMLHYLKDRSNYLSYKDHFCEFESYGNIICRLNLYQTSKMGERDRCISDIGDSFVVPGFANSGMNLSLGLYSLDCLFSCFSTDVIVDTIKAVMLEYFIVIQSNMPYKASTCVEALRALLHPCKVQVPIIPMIPGNVDVSDIFSCPYPYIIGCTKQHNFTQDAIPLPHYIADADTGEVERSVMYKMMNEDKLKESLKKFMKSVSKKSTSDVVKNKYYNKIKKIYKQNYIFSKENVKEVLGIVNSAIQKPIEAFVYSTSMTDASDPSNPISYVNKELLSQVLREHADANFVKRFLETSFYFNASEFYLTYLSNSKREQSVEPDCSKILNEIQNIRNMMDKYCMFLD